MAGRFTLIVLDGCGVGGAQDAKAFGDEGSNTIGNMAAARRAAGTSLEIPNLERWGLGRVVDLARVGEEASAETVPVACYGRMRERSAAKDSTAGHWEMMGVEVSCPFPTYPHGFPEGLVDRISKAVGHELIGNEVASGTEIVSRLGGEAVVRRALILYTSADSVFQLAAHEDVVGVEDLYRACEIARGILVGEHGVSRVIARPFVGEPGAFKRTSRRKDFSLPPPPTVLDALSAAGVSVWGLGKVAEVFAYRGFAGWEHTPDDMSTVDAVCGRLDGAEPGLLFANLGDYDTLWGHRNDVAGFAEGLEAFDRRMPEIERVCGPGDVVAMTADHGCDPTTRSTDHSREEVPLLVWRKDASGGRAGCGLGTRDGFFDVGASVAEHFGVPWQGAGRSFLGELS